MANTVAPAGSAVVLQDEAASSAVELEVEAERYCTNSSAHLSIGALAAQLMPSGQEMELRELAGAAAALGWPGVVLKRVCW